MSGLEKSGFESDVHDRMSMHRAIMGSIRAGQTEGAFNGLDPQIPELLDGHTPVGLDIHRNVVLPDSYDMENGPAILTLGAHEDTRLNLHAASSKIAKNFSKDSIGDYVQLHDGDFSNVPGWAGALVMSSYFRDTNAVGDNIHQLPVVMILRESQEPKMLDVIAASHELDHWGLLLDRRKNTYSVDTPTEDVLAEKYQAEDRAYSGSYEVVKNMQLDGYLPQPEELAAQLGKVDFRADRNLIVRAFRNLFVQHAEQTEVIGLLQSTIAQATVVARVLSMAYNETETGVSSPNVAHAFKQFGLI